MWSNVLVSRTRLGFVVLMALLCSGCGFAFNKWTGVYVDHVDLSNSHSTEDEVAVFRGSYMEVPLIGYSDCFLAKTNPPQAGPAKKLTLNPGPLTLMVRCEIYSYLGGPGTEEWETATFNLDAIAGHSYKIQRHGWQDCTSLKDTTDGSVVATNCAADVALSEAGPEGVAVIQRASGDDCWLTTDAGATSGPARKLTVSPGLVDVSIDCELWTNIPELPSVSARFHYEATAAHTYKVKLNPSWSFPLGGRVCIELRDTTERRKIDQKCWNASGTVVSDR